MEPLDGIFHRLIRKINAPWRGDAGLVYPFDCVLCRGEPEPGIEPIHFDLSFCTLSQADDVIQIKHQKETARIRKIDFVKAKPEPAPPLSWKEGLRILLTYARPAPDFGIFQHGLPLAIEVRGCWADVEIDSLGSTTEAK